MKTTKKIFLPRWQRYFLVPMMLGIWLFITYMEFFNPGASDKMGLVEYVFFSALFIGLTIMMWFMTGGRLPAYIIEEKSEEK